LDENVVEDGSTLCGHLITNGLNKRKYITLKAQKTIF